MALFDRFGRRPPPPASPPAPLRLQPAPAYQPLPSNPADPVDLELVRLWSAYQRDEPHPTWDSFLAMLTQANASLLHEIRHTEGLLTSSRRQGDFVP